MAIRIIKDYLIDIFHIIKKLWVKSINENLQKLKNLKPTSLKI